MNSNNNHFSYSELCARVGERMNEHMMKMGKVDMEDLKLMEMEQVRCLSVAETIFGAE